MLPVTFLNVICIGSWLEFTFPFVNIFKKFPPTIIRLILCMFRSSVTPLKLAKNKAIMFIEKHLLPFDSSSLEIIKSDVNCFGYSTHVS